jgi:hypothetical protein
MGGASPLKSGYPTCSRGGFTNGFCFEVPTMWGGWEDDTRTRTVGCFVRSLQSALTHTKEIKKVAHATANHKPACRDLYYPRIC